MDYKGLKFMPNMPWSRVSASGMNSLVEAVKRAKGEIVELRTKVDKPERRRITQKTVLMVATPAAGSPVAKVREVRYPVPPRPCESSTCFYEFYGPEFDAYPWFGQDVADYDVHGTGAIGKDAPFYEAVFRHNSWLLEKPAVATGGGADIRYCVVISATGNTQTIRVQPCKTGDDGLPIADGGEETIPTFPNHAAGLYADYVRFNIIGASDTLYLPLVKHKDGVWRVWPMIPFSPNAPSNVTLSGQCNVS